MATDDQTRSAPLPPTASHSGDPERTVTRDPSNPPGDPQAEVGTQAQTPDQMARSAVNSGAAGAAPDAVPGYELVSELGRGGMGVVYRARDTRLNRDVALKMILRADASRTTVARFWAEAEVMAAVKHPNVVQVHELGEHDGRPFLAMEYVAGGSLEKRAKAGLLAPEEAAALMAKVAAGVAAAHEQGIVHRDLKPGNVLLTSDGSPKVTDFGIAKRQSHDLTATQALMGTPAYMAPEQAAAKAKFVGPQADVWSLGVMLYECLAGQRPFAGDTVESVFSRILFAEPPALRTVSRSVPPDLETIVTKCLSKEPEHRYPTAADLAADLERFVRHEPIAARPVGPVERFARWVRRKPTAAAAWGFSSLAVLLAVVVFVVFGFWRDAEGAREVAEGAKKDAEAARDEADRLRGIADARRLAEARLRGAAETAEKEARHQKGIAEEARGVAEEAQKKEARLRKGADDAREAAEEANAKQIELRKQVERQREELAAVEYGRTIQVAHQEWRDNNIVGARALLESTDPTRRRWEWQYVHRLCNASLLTLKGHKAPVLGAAFSPDGSRVVTASEDNTARVHDAKTGAELLTLVGHADGVESAQFSPDGARVVTASRDKTARVWEVPAAKPEPGKGSKVVVLEGHTKGVYWAQFSPDGSKVVTGGRDKSARVFDARTGKELVVLGGHADAVTAAAFSPDGARVVTASGDKTARVWDALTGKELLALKGHTSYVYAAAFSPDGARVVTASADRTARAWDAETGAELFTLSGHAGPVSSVCFSPDGARVVTGSADRTARVWNARSGAELLTLKGHTAGVTAVAVAADGSRVVTGSHDRTARVWDAKTAPEVAAFKGRPNVLSLPPHGPDGSRLEINPDGSVQLWAIDGARKTKVAGHREKVTSACLSPDGTQILTSSWDGTAKVWDARTGEERFVLRGHTERVLFAVYSPEGGRIVTGGADGTAKVWDARLGVVWHTLKGHTGAVSSAAFNGLGSRIVTGSADRTAKVWDAKTGAELLALKGHTDPIEAVAFGADDWQVLTWGQDGMTRVWDAKPLDRDFFPRPLAPAPRPKK